MTALGLNWLDWVVIVGVLLSSFMGLWRGFTKEILALIVWATAAYFALILANTIVGQWLQDLLADWISNATIQYGLTLTVLFLMLLVIGSVLKNALASFIDNSSLAGLNKLLGFVFGFIRGMLIIVLTLVLLESLTKLPNEPVWQASKLVAPLTQSANQLAFSITSLKQ